MQDAQVPAEDGQGNGALDAEIDQKIDEVVRALRRAVDARANFLITESKNRTQPVF